MDEFSFIKSIKQHTYKQPSLVKGIGDDAAVFRQTNQDIVTATDTMVEDIHFSRKTMNPFQIGYRALAVNLSDLAAMAAKPAFYLVSIVIPTYWRTEDVQGIFKGMQKLASSYSMDLIGGDTTSGKELCVSVTIIGYSNQNKARYRHSAKPGDIVFATGTLGDSRAGFHMLMNPGVYRDYNYFVRRHRTPSPRVSFAMNLDNVSRMALNDISDGIASEASEIAEASGVSLVLKYADLPASSHYNQFTTGQRRKWQLFGGEDFELVGTVAELEWPVLSQVACETDTAITKIGYVTEQQHSFVYLQEESQCNPLDKQGYTHLKQVRPDE